jgi:hypothetical protein
MKKRKIFPRKLMRMFRNRKIYSKMSTKIKIKRNRLVKRDKGNLDIELSSQSKTNRKLMRRRKR